MLLPAMQCAVDLVNNIITSFFDPAPLPKLDFSKGIPDECTTLVAVPTLLLNEKQVRELVNDLEVRFLANRDPHLHFALLTDLPDSVSKPHDNDSNPLVEPGHPPHQRSECAIRIAASMAASSSSIAIASSTCARACGWAGSASAASCST